MTDSIKERPILFSSEMVRAILDGHKTQTRRVIKERYQLCRSPEDEPEVFVDWCPYGKPGDLLWLRETFAYVSKTAELSPIEECNIEYKADTGNPYPGDWPVEEAKGNPDAPKWRPSIFMPRWASRLTLKIIAVRVERLQDISYEDAVAEGTPGAGLIGANTAMLVTGTNNLDDAEKAMRLASFAELWDSINAKRGYPWDSNPYVWVIEFERINQDE